MVLFTAFLGCEKESEGLSKITYFPEIILDGGAVVVAIGGDYVEPGYTGSEQGVDKTGDIIVSNNINAAKAGIYSVTYTLINGDGIKKVESRSVVVAVADADAPASGVYSTTTVRTESDGSNPRPRSSEISVINIGDDVFEISCFLGYYYAAGYGPAYAMVGTVKFNKADNTFTLVESSLEGWGDSLEAFNNGSYNPETGVLYWESIYAGADIFAVTCTK